MRVCVGLLKLTLYLDQLMQAGQRSWVRFFWDVLRVITGASSHIGEGMASLQYVHGWKPSGTAKLSIVLFVRPIRYAANGLRNGVGFSSWHMTIRTARATSGRIPHELRHGFLYVLREDSRLPATGMPQPPTR
jgi:hypothetical protein